MATHRDLVLVRVGQSSLHPRWAAQPEQRNWDLGVSAFVETPPVAPGTAYDDYYVGGKWDGLWHFFQRHPDVLDRYDYFWFPDDDLLFDCDSANRLFAIARDRGLELAQPALSLESYFSHLITVRHPAFALRFTNFVELMAPVMSAAFLRKVLPYFQGRKSARGLDMAWARFVSGGPEAVGIVDAVDVLHTRPHGTALKRYIASTGIDPEAERHATIAQFNVQDMWPMVLGGVLRDGSRLSGRRAVLWPLAKGYLRDLAAVRDHRRWFLKSSYQLYKQAFKADLSLRAGA